MGAMAGYGVGYLSGSPWLGVLRRRPGRHCAGRAARLVVRPAAGQRRRHGHRPDAVRHRPGVFLGKPLIQPKAPTLPSVLLGYWSDSRRFAAALQVNVLFLSASCWRPLLALGAPAIPAGD